MPPYDCLLLQSAASAHLPRGVGDRRLIGNARSGGRLAMGPCLGAYAVASIVPLSLASYPSLSLLSLQPHFLPFPLLLLATAPCPAPSCRHCVVIYYLIVGLSVPPMPHQPAPFCCLCRGHFGTLPAPSCQHCYCKFNCRIVCAADAASSASYLSSSSLRPQFWHPSPLPLCRSSPLHRFPCRPPPTGDAGERALEEAPTTVIFFGHAAMDDGDGHSPLHHSLCMMIQYTW